jgi:signal transduction histidine kinase
MIAPTMLHGATETTLRILHLEDSPADQQLTQLALRRAGWNAHIEAVDTLTGFQDALQRMDCDVILADYHLPGFTALDAWALLTQRTDPPPFILLSGAIGEAAAVEAIRQGMADYVLKDDLTRLPHVIERALEVHNARKAQARATAELAASRQSLAELTEHLQTSIEQERAAIAREIHDDIGGALTAVLFDLSWIGRHAQQPPVQEHAQAATAMLQHALGASQRIMMNLRPPMLDQGLVAALRWLADNFAQRTGIAVSLQLGRDITDLDHAVQLVAYRTAQEALTNISKYAQASSVRMELTDTESVLTLEVTDNGRGFDPAAPARPRSFGLPGLRERARTVGGWLDVSSRPGQGSSVILSVPLTPLPDSGDAP